MIEKPDELDEIVTNQIDSYHYKDMREVFYHLINGYTNSKMVMGTASYNVGGLDFDISSRDMNAPKGILSIRVVKTQVLASYGGILVRVPLNEETTKSAMWLRTILRTFMTTVKLNDTLGYDYINFLVSVYSKCEIGEPVNWSKEVQAVIDEVTKVNNMVMARRLIENQSNETYCFSMRAINKEGPGKK